MFMNRKIPDSASVSTYGPRRAIDLDWEPPARASLSTSAAARFGRWAFSRSEIVGRAFRDLYRSRGGFMLVWANVILWTIYAIIK